MKASFNSHICVPAAMTLYYLLCWRFSLFLLFMSIISFSTLAGMGNGRSNYCFYHISRAAQGKRPQERASEHSYNRKSFTPISGWLASSFSIRFLLTQNRYYLSFVTKANCYLCIILYTSCTICIKKCIAAGRHPNLDVTLPPPILGCAPRLSIVR